MLSKKTLLMSPKIIFIFYFLQIILTEMQKKTTYIKLKVVNAFPNPMQTRAMCVRGLRMAVRGWLPSTQSDRYGLDIFSANR
jgi:hypothetical protein